MAEQPETLTAAPTAGAATAFPERVAPNALAQFCRAVLDAIGADQPTAEAMTRAMLHASKVGVDSHGVRLLPHYVRVMLGGRVNPRPQLRFAREFGATALLDADHGHGARAGYAAMDKAVTLARSNGVGAVAVANSSHFGAAGAYALAAAEAGLIGLTVCNSDAFVRLHDGAKRFHGTNPIAFAAPVAGEQPWLLDMATSAIPYNRVLLYRSLGEPLPDGVASDDHGIDTNDAHGAEMLAPLGGMFGFKGAGLAGMAEILSATLSGMRLSHEILPMLGPDFATPRAMGQFFLALQPEAFVERGTFDAQMRRYRHDLQNSATVAGSEVMAPGDREWRVAETRARDGIPVDPTTRAAFDAFAAEHGLHLPT